MTGTVTLIRSSSSNRDENLLLVQETNRCLLCDQCRAKDPNKKYSQAGVSPRTRRCERKQVVPFRSIKFYSGAGVLSSSKQKGVNMACKPFSVTLAVLAPDNKRQISFGITKGCISDDQAFFVLNFVLRDLVNGDFQDRVRLHVEVGDTDSDKAQRIIDRGLTMTQLNWLQGPVTNKTKALPVGTTNNPAAEQTLSNIVNK